MKVIAFNGSPKKEGNTYQSIKLVADKLIENGIEVEIVHIGNKNIAGCTGCGACVNNKNEKCINDSDEVNECIQKVKDADGIIFGSPVYYAGVAGNMKCFLDRFFYVTSMNNMMLRHKVGAAIVTVRRTGGLTTYDELNHYINYSEMFIPGSNYWNILHGAAPGEIKQDPEGIQIANILGDNMAFLMKSLELNRVNAPEMKTKTYTNFIR